MSEKGNKKQLVGVALENKMDKQNRRDKWWSYNIYMQWIFWFTSHKTSLS